ncbi:MAG: hypothetical protein MHM6MM_005642 [Cercozoa sp. M6MM]
MESDAWEDLDSDFGIRADDALSDATVTSLRSWVVAARGATTDTDLHIVELSSDEDDEIDRVENSTALDLQDSSFDHLPELGFDAHESDGADDEFSDTDCKSEQSDNETETNQAKNETADDWGAADDDGWGNDDPEAWNLPVEVEVPEQEERVVKKPAKPVVSDRHWQCSMCTTINRKTRLLCKTCGLLQRGVKGPDSIAERYKPLLKHGFTVQQVLKAQEFCNTPQQMLRFLSGTDRDRHELAMQSPSYAAKYRQRAARKLKKQKKNGSVPVSMPSGALGYRGHQWTLRTFFSYLQESEEVPVEPRVSVRAAAVSIAATSRRSKFEQLYHEQDRTLSQLGLSSKTTRKTARKPQPHAQDDESSLREVSELIGVSAGDDGVLTATLHAQQDFLLSLAPSLECDLADSAQSEHSATVTFGVPAKVHSVSSDALGDRVALELHLSRARTLAEQVKSTVAFLRAPPSLSANQVNLATVRTRLERLPVRATSLEAPLAHVHFSRFSGMPVLMFYTSGMSTAATSHRQKGVPMTSSLQVARMHASDAEAPIYACAVLLGSHKKHHVRLMDGLMTMLLQPARVLPIARIDHI